MSPIVPMGIEIAAKGTVLLAIAALAIRQVRKSKPAISHIAWLAVFAGLLALPPFIAGSSLRTTLFIPGFRNTLEPVQTLNNHAKPIHGLERNGFPSNATESPSVPEARAAQEQSISTTDFIACTWLLGFTFVLARCIVSLFALALLRRFGTRVVDKSALPISVDTLAHATGLKSNWELRQSVTSEPATAMTWGMFRPVILLPLDASDWSPQRLESVLLHEFAHVRRFDFASQLLAELACALYWFNPLVWLGARAMREGAEAAADEAVVRSGVKPSVYAAELLQIAAALGNRRQTLSRIGVSAMTQPKIESRLKAVLSSSARHRGVTSVHVLACATFVLFGATAIGTLRVTTQQPTGVDRPAAEKTAALIRVKQIALATIMYSVDYDEVPAVPPVRPKTRKGEAVPMDKPGSHAIYPYVSSTASITYLIQPYLRNASVMQSPTIGAKFEFNLNLGGVFGEAIKNPESTPLWYETVPGDYRVAVAYCDGHARLVAKDDPKFVAALKETFPRDKRSKPLPKNLGIKRGEPAGGRPASVLPKEG